MVRGKSTLSKLIAGLVKPSKGEVNIDGLKTSNKKNFFEIRKQVGIVFQNPENQIIFNNVYDDLAFALNNLNVGAGLVPAQNQRIKNALSQVKMLEYINKNTYELSLGQKQRITIAGVLAVGPKYIIFDEPTAMLDSEGKEDVYKIVRELKKQGYTIIYVTNVADEMLIGDKIVVIEEGEIVNIFEKESILNKAEKLIKSGFKLPTLVEMVLKLKELGINIKLENWTTEEFAQKIKS